MQNIEGNFQGEDLNIAIVCSRFNEMIVQNLLKGALDGLKRHGTTDITTVWVPGAFELGQTAQKLASTQKFDAIICLGCVIRGATTHYDYVCAQAASQIAVAGTTSQTPVIFGVLTTETIEQAIERSGTKCGNKGFDSAMSAIEMANVFKTIDLEPQENWV